MERGEKVFLGLLVAILTFLFLSIVVVDQLTDARKKGCILALVESNVPASEAALVCA